MGTSRRQDAAREGKEGLMKKKKKRRLTYDELDDLLFCWKLMEQAEDEEERKRIREQMDEIERGYDHDNA